MHRAGRTLHDEAKGNGAPVESFVLDACKVGADVWGEVVAYHDNLLSIVLHEDAEETVDEVFTVDFHQWFRGVDALLSKPRAFTSGNDGISHFVNFQCIL